jgi:hypothetical protein
MQCLTQHPAARIRQNNDNINSASIQRNAAQPPRENVPAPKTENDHGDVI